MRFIEENLDGPAGKEIDIIIRTLELKKGDIKELGLTNPLYFNKSVDLLDVLVAVGAYKSRNLARKDGWLPYLPHGWTSRLRVGSSGNYPGFGRAYIYLNIWNPKQYLSGK